MSSAPQPYSELSTQPEKKSCLGESECPHKRYGWSFSVYILACAIVLLILLIYSNAVHILHLDFELWTERPSVYPGRKTVIYPKQTLYSVNLYSDCIELWTSCFEVSGQKKCENPTPKQRDNNRIIAALLFTWSICFPFFKIILSLIFWFFSAPSGVRAWAMWAKVNIGRWTIIESFFIWYWAYGLGFQDDYEVPHNKYIDGLVIHARSSGVFTNVTAIFIAAQLGSLALSHYIMKKTERLYDPIYVVERNDNIFQYPCKRQQRRQIEVDDYWFVKPTDPSIKNYGDDGHAPKEAYTCPKVWNVDGVLVRFLVTGLLIANIILLIHAIFIQTSFSERLTGSFFDKIPELANNESHTIWSQIKNLPSHANGAVWSLQVSSLLSLVLAPLVSSSLLLLFWLSTLTTRIPDSLKSSLRSWAAMVSVYSCIDVAVCALYFSDRFYPQIISSLAGTDLISANITNGPAATMMIIYPIAHWILMAHCLTRPFLKKNVVLGGSSQTSEKEGTILGTREAVTGGSVSLQTHG